MYAGIQISGINAEVMPSQWEYQVRCCVGFFRGLVEVVGRVFGCLGVRVFGLASARARSEPYTTPKTSAVGPHSKPKKKKLNPSTP